MVESGTHHVAMPRILTWRTKMRLQVEPIGSFRGTLQAGMPYCGPRNGP